MISILLTTTAEHAIACKDLQLRSQLLYLTGTATLLIEMDSHRKYQSRELSELVAYKGQTDDYDARVLRRYLGFKIENYKQQDEKAGRSIKVDNFVDCNWFINQFGKACPRCGDCFKFDINNGKVVDCNLTANRIDVSECHHFNNVNPLCAVCNQKLAQWEQ